MKFDTTRAKIVFKTEKAQNGTFGTEMNKQNLRAEINRYQMIEGNSKVKNDSGQNSDNEDDQNQTKGRQLEILIESAENLEEIVITQLNHGFLFDEFYEDKTELVFEEAGEPQAVSKQLDKWARVKSDIMTGFNILVQNLRSQHRSLNFFPPGSFLCIYDLIKNIDDKGGYKKA